MRVNLIEETLMFVLSELPPAPWPNSKIPELTYRGNCISGTAMPSANDATPQPCAAYKRIIIICMSIIIIIINPSFQTQSPDINHHCTALVSHKNEVIPPISQAMKHESQQ